MDFLDLSRFDIDYEGLLDVGYKLVAAVILAGLLGLEREMRGRAAGLRTHILVCLGATLAMIVSGLLYDEASLRGGIPSVDASRIAAGIITGIGFLGAGTIINIRNTQVGLTTAALVWFSAALGIAIGAGFIAVATISAIAALLVVFCFRLLGQVLPVASRYRLCLRIPEPRVDTEGLARAIRKQGFKVDFSNLIYIAEADWVELTFYLSTSSKANIEDLVDFLRDRYGTLEKIVFES